LNADIFARGESDHSRPTFDRVALLWTPHDEMFAAIATAPAPGQAEAPDAAMPQLPVVTPRQCAYHAAAAASIVRSSARDISLGIATDIQRHLPPASTLARVTLDEDDDTLALADASRNSRLPIDPARCIVFEAIINHGGAKTAASSASGIVSVRCVTLDDILADDCVCAAVRPLALDGYSLIKQNRFDPRRPAPEIATLSVPVAWSQRGLCVYREWERVLDAFKASVLPRLLPTDRDAAPVLVAALLIDFFTTACVESLQFRVHVSFSRQLIQSILASLAARVSAAPPEPRHLVATSRIFSASVAVHGVDGKIPHETCVHTLESATLDGMCAFDYCWCALFSSCRLVSTLSLLPHLLGGQQSTAQILEQLEPHKDTNGAISEDGAC
jgi:hypothetical protein